MKVVLSRRANLDLTAQLDWLTQLSPAVARAAEREIRRQLKTLAEFPAAGGEIDTGERLWPIRYGRDGFVVIYRIEPDRVVIGRLFHGSQERP